MLFPITFGIYLSLLAMVAWEDLAAARKDYQLKA